MPLRSRIFWVLYPFLLMGAGFGSRAVSEWWRAHYPPAAYRSEEVAEPITDAERQYLAAMMRAYYESREKKPKRDTTLYRPNDKAFIND